MPLIHWKDDYSVGVPEVDLEHRELIALINAAHDEMQREGTPDSVTRFLGEIYTRIAAHFALEEKVMRAEKYDQYLDHKTDHERLLDEIRDIMDAYDDGQLYDEAQFARVLSAWFVGHFSSHDARLHKRLGV